MDLEKTSEVETLKPTQYSIEIHLMASEMKYTDEQTNIHHLPIMIFLQTIVENIRCKIFLFSHPEIFIILFIFKLNNTN